MASMPVMLAGLWSGARLYLLYDFVGDQHRFIEFFRSVHHAVSDGVDLRVVLDASDGGIGQVVEYGFDGSLMVGESEGLYFFRSVGFLEFEESVGESDFLYSAFGHGVVCIGIDQFVFHGTAAAVKH